MRIHLSSSRCTTSQTVHAERRNMSDSDEIHRRYQNDSYILGCNGGETYWRLLERGWRKRIIWCMDRLHKNHFIERKGHLMGTHGSGGDLQGHKQPLVQTMYGPICGLVCQMQQRRKQNRDGLSRNQCSTMPDNWEEIILIEPSDEDIKLTIKTARRKLEVPMPAAMPCKIQIKSSGATCRNIEKRKTKYSCIVEADESTKELCTNLIKITSLQKGMNSLTHYSLVHKFIPMAQAMQIPNAKAAVVKEWEKLKKFLAWQLTKSQKQERLDRWSKE